MTKHVEHKLARCLLVEYGPDLRWSWDDVCSDGDEICIQSYFDELDYGINGKLRRPYGKRNKSDL